MTNRERYRETFSQLRPSRTVRWEDYETVKKQRRIPARRLVTAAAVAALLCGLSVTAVATNFLGLGELLLPGRQEVDTLDPETGVVVPGQKHEVDAISLSGFMDAPESRALAEWQDFLAAYDADHAILDEVGNYLDPALERYICYQVYTQDMADKLEEIAAKYGLKLHTQFIDLYAHPEALGPMADFARDERQTYWMYMYEEGSCHFDGYAYVEDWGLVDVQFQRAVKGYFNDVTLNIGDVADFEQWTYRTASGVEVLLAMAPGRSLIFADRPDCFASFNVFIGTDGGMTRARLEGVADRYDFTKLSPVEPPAVIPTQEPQGVPAGERTDAGAVYGQVLRDLLYEGQLPGGGGSDPTWEDRSGDQFALYDVDFDGREELILLHTSDIMAGVEGYVLDFDPTYTGTEPPIAIELQEFPDLTFYENGMVEAGWSHNQTWGELWPYTLYFYEPEADYYSAYASAYAADRALMEEIGHGEEYPAEADKCGGGTVYYVSFPYSSGVEPAGDRVWDEEEYLAWRDSLLGRAQKVELPYQALTEDNIAATFGGAAPVQTVPPEGMPKG